jgi:peptidoglycan/xylan/chitin deacetylase (PgdA/CDA1 family)
MRWLPILSYHRVVYGIPADDRSALCMPFTAFRRQVELLHRHGYRSMALEDAGRALVRGEPLPSRTFAITFDDGYRDTWEVAAPVLSQLGFTATIFMVAGLVGAENRWDSGILSRAPLLTWEQLAELRAAGCSIGSHTVSHADLSRVPLVEARREVTESRERLEQGLGASVSTFAYPYGRWTPTTRDAVAEAGYEFACNGTWCCEHERYALARVDARYALTPFETLLRMQAPVDQVRRGLRRATGRGGGRRTLSP